MGQGALPCLSFSVAPDLDLISMLEDLRVGRGEIDDQNDVSVDRLTRDRDQLW